MKRLLICYDIPDSRRRSRVAHMLEAHGERVQKSVFECDLDARQEAGLRTDLAGLIDPREDKLRFYSLCGKDYALLLSWDARGALQRRHAWVM